MVSYQSILSVFNVYRVLILQRYLRIVLLFTVALICYSNSQRFLIESSKEWLQAKGHNHGSPHHHHGEVHNHQDSHSHVGTHAHDGQHAHSGKQDTVYRSLKMRLKINKSFQFRWLIENFFISLFYDHIKVNTLTPMNMFTPKKKPSTTTNTITQNMKVSKIDIRPFLNGNNFLKALKIFISNIKVELEFSVSVVILIININNQYWLSINNYLNNNFGTNSLIFLS